MTQQLDYPITTWPTAEPDEILPGLYQGGTEDDDVLGYGTHRRTRGDFPFDLVVTAYADANPVPWHVEEIRFGFYDSALDGGDIPRIVRIARQAHARWKQGDQVLVRCQAGVNRSGLISALILLLEGYSPEDAIGLLRTRRSSHVLANRHFEQWLCTEAVGWLDPSLGATLGDPAQRG
ncbi:MAG TPA: hypothetical protein DHW34_02345 [Actinobacteria bacterium]|nr:hypothetical protein [Actinomycetota bacterium]